MSMELHVFFHGSLPDTVALSRAMHDLGFPLAVMQPGGSLEQQRGYLPMRLNGADSGVEFDVFEGRGNIEAIRDELDVDPRFDRTASFRWGGDENEMLCASCAAAALAQLVKGVALGDYDEEPITSDEAVAVAREYLVAAAAPSN